ncbi:hypothetical protein NCAS_0D00660 [Naumovozyma castellii]|uniref:FAD-binding FR-type domain-containing protein n=1 Tax=Naumovozyma castellii TaxID=27288 RepID=G0VEV2_NAUCA|nr:hypothetical protein NCAS_0D00660 [Naumovozyma castellii CBS 4309]CCC69647.1 hypothetical protein NCAS_0D00660 [Naumovozyma castellii CBS 4309]
MTSAEELNFTALSKRHEGASHYANIWYGHYVFSITIVYAMIVVLLQYMNKRSRTPVKNRFLRRIRFFDPWAHLTLLSIPIIIAFFSSHYSWRKNLSVYMKRVGRLSYALIPLNLFYNLRFSNSMNYIDLIPLHKWLSRILCLLALIHSIAFFIMWATEGVLVEAVSDPYMALGVAIFAMVIILMFCSLKPFRRRYYNAFYIIHNLMNFSFIIMTPIHSKPGIVFPLLITNIILLCLQIFIKMWFVKPVTVVKKIVESDSSLVVIQFPRECIDRPDFSLITHVRISEYSSRWNPLFWIYPSHPYTVASIAGDNTLDLVITENTFKLKEGHKYAMINYYCQQSKIPPSFFERDPARLRDVQIICGGSGIAFGLPIFRYLLNLENSGMESNIKRCELIWLINDVVQLDVLKHIFKYDSMPENFTFRVFVSHTAGGNSGSVGDLSDNTDLEIEMDSLAIKNGEEAPYQNVKFRRFDFVDDAKHLKESFDPWVFCCGPDRLISGATQFAKDGNINLVTESYGF